MKRKGRDAELKVAYKDAFEESFVDNYGGWRDTMDDVNDSLAAIGEIHKRKKLEPYQYDEFCCLAKLVIEKHIDAMDWDRIIQDELRLVRFKKGKRNQLAARANMTTDKMGTEVWFACFEKAILERVGPRLYRMYKDEIEQLKKCSITL